METYIDKEKILISEVLIIKRIFTRMVHLYTPGVPEHALS